MTGSIEGHTRDEGYIDGIVVIKESTRGFHDVEGTFAQVGFGGIAAQLHRIVARHTGEYDVLAGSDEGRNKRTDIDLVR